MDDFAVSISNVRIRLPDERWQHIAEEYAELVGMRREVLDTISAPEQVLAGTQGESLAVRELTDRKWLIVIYREADDGGFIITAFMTRREGWFAKRHVIWSR